MGFEVAVYDVDERLFQPGTANPTTPAGSRQVAKLSPAQELEAWRRRAEEITRNYQRLVKSYRQLKSHLKEEAQWRRRCNTMAAAALRNCRDLQLALAAAREQGVEHPASAALIAGIEQVIEKQLSQLCEQGLIEAIEPQPAEIPDRNLHEVVGTKQTDEFAEGLIAEVAGIGYARDGEPVRKARVILAVPASQDKAPPEVEADGL